jgi:hypothetical protein
MSSQAGPGKQNKIAASGIHGVWRGSRIAPYSPVSQISCFETATSRKPCLTGKMPVPLDVLFLLR